jgi:hypothetical protein
VADKPNEQAEDSVHQTFYQMRKYHSVSRQTNSKQTGEMKNYPEIVQARLQMTVSKICSSQTILVGNAPPQPRFAAVN